MRAEKRKRKRDQEDIHDFFAKKKKEANNGSLAAGFNYIVQQIKMNPTMPTEFPTVTPRQRRETERMVQLNKTLAERNKEYLERFGHYRVPTISNWSFQEKIFGCISSEHPWASKVVSLALYDGDKMLYACSGVALPLARITMPVVSRFVTSIRLVAEFKNFRNRDDNLRIHVRLPNKETFDGFLGLYDDHIAIVTSFRFANVLPLDLHSNVERQNQHNLVAVGRVFSSGTLMTTAIKYIDDLSQKQPPNELIPFPCPITVAGLGGPVLNQAGDVMGLSIHVDINKETTLFLPRWELCKHLAYLEQFTPNSTNLREYTLPVDVDSIVPSGFMADVNYLKSCGYPKPPPLVLEIGGRLFNKFEEDFGELYGYKALQKAYAGYAQTISDDVGQAFLQVWAKPKKKVVTNICRRVVSLSSYKGSVRSFSCTGLLIKWHKNGTPVVLTSASLVRSQSGLVRSQSDEDKIDDKLEIKVFLPPNQSVDGRLELYHSDYNIAVISLKSPLYGTRPEDIFHTLKWPRRVVAIARGAEYGVLMATIGKPVKKLARDILHCEDLRLSTCKIKKVGIGGPLVNFVSGSFAGMNFYGETDVTPFLPRGIIREVLSKTDLPFSRGMDHAIDIMGDTTVKKNRWPVPKPYWYHPLFDDDPPRRFYGRQLQ